MKARKYWTDKDFTQLSKTSVHLSNQYGGVNLLNKPIIVVSLDAESVEELRYDLNGLLVSGHNLPTHIQAERIMNHFGITAKRPRAKASDKHFKILVSGQSMYLETNRKPTAKRKAKS